MKTMIKALGASAIVTSLLVAGIATADEQKGMSGMSGMEGQKKQ